MKPGWRTSELTVGLLCGLTIGRLATMPCDAMALGIVRGCACLALAWIAGRYAHARAEVKRAG